MCNHDRVRVCISTHGVVFPKSWVFTLPFASSLFVRTKALKLEQFPSGVYVRKHFFTSNDLQVTRALSPMVIFHCEYVVYAFTATSVRYPKKTHTPFLTILTFLNDSNTLLKHSPMPTRELHGIVKDLTALDALITIVQFSTYEFDITHKIRHVCKTRTREMTLDGLVFRREGETYYIPFLVQIIYINIMTNGEKRKTGRNKKTVTSSGTPLSKKKFPNYIELHRNSVIDIRNSFRATPYFGRLRDGVRFES